MKKIEVECIKTIEEVCSEDETTTALFLSGGLYKAEVGEDTAFVYTITGCKLKMPIKDFELHFHEAVGFIDFIV